MKRQGRKIAALVCWDTGTARAADAAGIEIVSIGDSGAQSLDELLVFCAAVRRGVERALVSCDLPDPSVDDARRLADAGADLVKVESVEHVQEIAAAGVPVFAEIVDTDEAKPAEAAGAVLIDFRHSGPEAGARAVAAVSIPVLGGLGGGPWLDGRVRLAQTALGSSAKWLDSKADTYVNTAKLRLAAFKALIEDVRAGRQIKG